MIAASVVLAGAMFAQDKSASIDQSVQLFSKPTITFGLQREPQFMLGSTRVTGLLVDCAMPLQTWAMLNPPVVMRGSQMPMRPPVSVLPLKAPVINNGDLAVHEPDFDFLQFRF